MGYLRLFSDPKELVKHIKENYSLWEQLIIPTGLTLKPRGEITVHSIVENNKMFKEAEKVLAKRSPNSTADVQFYRRAKKELAEIAASLDGKEAALVKDMLSFLEGRIEPGLTTVTVEELSRSGQSGGLFGFRNPLALVIFLAALFFASLSGYETYRGEETHSAGLIEAVASSIPGVSWAGGVISSWKDAYDRWGKTKTKLPRGIETKFDRASEFATTDKLAAELRTLREKRAGIEPAELFGERAMVYGADGRPILLRELFEPANRAQYVANLRAELRSAEEAIAAKTKELKELDDKIADLNDPKKAMAKRASGTNINAQKKAASASRRAAQSAKAALEGTLPGIRGELNRYNVPFMQSLFPMERLQTVGPELNRQFRKAAEAIVVKINRLPQDLMSNSARPITELNSEISSLAEAMRRSDAFREMPDAVEPVIEYTVKYLKNLVYDKLVGNTEMAIAQENSRIQRANMGAELYKELDFYEAAMESCRKRGGADCLGFGKLMEDVLDEMRMHGFQVIKEKYPSVIQSLLDWFQQEASEKSYATLGEIMKHKDSLGKRETKKLKEALWTFLTILIPFGSLAAVFEYLFGRPPPPPPPAPVIQVLQGQPPPMLGGPQYPYPMLGGPGYPPGYPQIGYPGYPPPQWPQLAGPAAIGAAAPGLAALGDAGPAAAAPIALGNAPRAAPRGQLLLGNNAGRLALVPAGQSGLRQRRAASPGPRRAAAFQLGNLGGVTGGARTQKRNRRNQRRTRRST